MLAVEPQQITRKNERGLDTPMFAAAGVGLAAEFHQLMFFVQSTVMPTFGYNLPSQLLGDHAMQRLIQLEKKIRSYDAVCELLKYSEVLLPGTQFYLAQLREVLGNEIAELEHEENESLAS